MGRWYIPLVVLYINCFGSFTWKIKDDKKLQELLNEYHVSKNESIKEEILENDLFREYKSKETDLNILIMSINQKLKTINNERRCSKWK